MNKEKEIEEFADEGTGEQTMSREKQIEEMARALNNYFDKTPMQLSFKHKNGDEDIITDEKALCVIDAITRQALIPVFCEALYNAGYRKQSEGEWIEHPHFNFEGGYSGANYECSNCHYDDCYEKEPYCPKCGAKMKGGAE